MERGSIILAAIVASTIVGHFPFVAMAREEPSEAERLQFLLPPRVDHLGIRATLLNQGMPVADVMRIMGAPTQVDGADEEDGVRVLNYPAEPIATTVAITDGKVSGVALDIAGVDELALPMFSRSVWVGMSRNTVLRLLGTPVEDRLRDGYGMSVEQMIFARPNAQDVSIFLVDGRVAGKKVGRLFPSDILSFALPLAPNPAGDEIDDVADRPKERKIRAGIEASELHALFGPPKYQLDYIFKGRPATYAIYDTSPGRSFDRFTLIDGVVTEFADGGTTPLSQILEAR
jgi:hypothetical protein